MAVAKCVGDDCQRGELVEIYIEQPNVHLAHTAFYGRTPVEIHFERDGDIPGKLVAAKLQAQDRRPRGKLPKGRRL